MNKIIIIEYLINLILLLLFYMHMFQLNSYSYKKHFRWLKVNVKKIVVQEILIVFPSILLISNNYITSIISIILLGISIIYNLPKGKAKISLKFTNRVKRMFIAEMIFILIVFMIYGIKNERFVKLGILNMIAFTMCIIANFVNIPMEYTGRKRCIEKAKKIIKDMPNLIVIGVTGSYGKTSVKNFLYKVLSGKYEVLVTPQNYNTTMGVVKTIRENLKSTHQIFICEMGATNVGDIKEICDIVRPKIGIITAIGPQHLETFKTIDNIIETKFELYHSVKENGGKVFLNYNNEHIRKKQGLENTIFYGMDNKELEYNSYDIRSSTNGLEFKMVDHSSNKQIKFETELIGKHNAINLAGTIAIADFLGIPFNDIQLRIKRIKSVEHRLQLLSYNQMNIIDDSYNSNPISSKSALDTLSEFEGTKIIVTPGLIELGDEEERYNFEFGQYMANKCDYIYLVGEKHSKPILEGIVSQKFNKKKIFIVSTPQEAMKEISNLNVKNKITVLLENDLPDNYNL